LVFTKSKEPNRDMKNKNAITSMVYQN
jgi:hypothetical protein